MDKILADLEDFTLPEKKPEPERDTESMKKIHNLLNKLIKFSYEYKDYENDDNIQSLDKLRTKFTQYFNKISRETKLNTKKTELILEYQKKVDSKEISKNILLEKLLCKKPSRSISGISSITLVMSPYPHGQSFSCKHNCYYCPNEPAHKGNNYQATTKRSYLYHEPAVRRANRNHF